MLAARGTVIELTADHMAVDSCMVAFSYADFVQKLHVLLHSDVAVAADFATVCST